MKVFVESDDFKQAIETTEGLEWCPLEEAQIVIQGRYQNSDYHPSHEAIIIPFTGHNGIDIPLLKEKGLRLYNTQAHARFVAERALALTLGLMGKVTLMHERLKRGDWSHRHNPQREHWTTLQGKKIGLYGYGAIGQSLHDFVRPFGSKVYTLDRGKDTRDAIKVPDLKSLFETVDVVVVCAPLTPSTQHSIHHGHLASFEGFLINVGRGTIIDEMGLYKALKEGPLRGFASDVWFRYPEGDATLSPAHVPLESFAQVLMSPHVAGFTDQSRALVIDDVCLKATLLAHGEALDALDLDRLDAVPFRK